MVERQLRRRGISDQRVLDAMREVPRRLFVPEERAPPAYADSALPIGSGQTISQPWIVAAICQALELAGRERVLEIGTGSGYSAAVLALLAAEVVTIERHAELAEEAEARIRELGITNVEVVVGDGSRGLPERAPFEAIAVHRGSAPAAQKPGGAARRWRASGDPYRPAGGRHADPVPAPRRRDHRRVIGPCRFVPLIGAEGFEGVGGRCRC